MIPKTLTAQLTRDRFNKPLAVIESSLGNGMEAYPEQLRALAATLLLVAAAAEARPTDVKHFAPVKRDFPTSKP